MQATATLLALLAFVPSCVAQQPAKTPPKEPFVVEAGELQLGSLIDRCATYLDCNILVTPQELAQGGAHATVRLQKGLSTDRDGCEELLASMLNRAGFALTQLDGTGAMREVLSLQGPRAREVAARAVHTTAEAVLERPNLKIWVLTTVPLQHINATVATNALRPFFATTNAGPGGITIGNVGNNTSLLLMGPQDQVAGAIRLVRACDAPPPKEEVAQAERLLDHLQRLESRLKAVEEKLAAQPGK